MPFSAAVPARSTPGIRRCQKSGRGHHCPLTIGDWFAPCIMFHQICKSSSCPLRYLLSKDIIRYLLCHDNYSSFFTVSSLEGKDPLLTSLRVAMVYCSFLPIRISCPILFKAYMQSIEVE